VARLYRVCQLSGVTKSWLLSPACAEAALEGDVDGLQSGLPPVAPSISALAGPVDVHDRLRQVAPRSHRRCFGRALGKAAEPARHHLRPRRSARHLSVPTEKRWSGYSLEASATGERATAALV
jgi:hypothetical protein